MIIDCYTHTWDATETVGLDVSRAALPLPGNGQAPETVSASRQRHLSACEPVDCAFVVGFTSRHLNVDLDNDAIADYVATAPSKLVGFAGIDPGHPRQAIEELARIGDRPGMAGIAVAPAAQDIHPTSSQALQVYAAAAERSLPVLFHNGVAMTSQVKLEYAQPILLDEVAREMPDLRILIAHLGFPWVGETLLLLAKHPNVYADISWILHRPWQAYQSLLAAHEQGVMHKLLFGSGFPFLSAAAAIEALFDLQHLIAGTGIAAIPRDALRQIVERDALSALGMKPRAAITADPDPLSDHATEL